MDENGSFPYPCDYFINYNIYGPDKHDELVSRYRNASLSTPVFLSGTEYVSLQKEFQNLPNKSTKIQAKSVFVSTGGADAEYLTLAIIRSIINSDTSLHFQIVVGEMNHDREEIEKQSMYDDRIEIWNNIKKNE